MPNGRIAIHKSIDDLRQDFNDHLQLDAANFATIKSNLNHIKERTDGQTKLIWTIIVGVAIAILSNFFLRMFG